MFDIQKQKHVDRIKKRGCMVNARDPEKNLCCSAGARLLLSREEEAAAIERGGDQGTVMWFSSGMNKKTQSWETLFRKDQKNLKSMLVKDQKKGINVHLPNMTKNLAKIIIILLIHRLMVL